MRQAEKNLASEADAVEILDRILGNGIVFDDIHRDISFAGVEILHVAARVEVCYAEDLFEQSKDEADFAGGYPR